MTNETEPRALGAALSAPAFVTRGNSVAMHAATRHIERWAPEQTAGRVRSMRSLGFVDRLVAPWMETAQRSASMRLLNQYASSGPSQREPGAVSWVFPRPWYQDELDWMAAARQTTAQSQLAQHQIAPTLLTTRGTYVAPSSTASSGPAVVMPSGLYEHVAPSLSIATSGAAQRQVAGVGHGGESLASREAYSPLVSLAAVQAAELMSRTVAPLATQRRGAGATTAMTSGLRSVLTSILERASAARGDEPTRLSLIAPEMVTPPAPRPSDLPGAMAAGSPASLVGAQGASPTTLQAAAAQAAAAARVAEQYAEQRARILELQRIAQQSAQREQIERAEAAARSQAADAATSAAAAATANRQSADARTAAIAAAAQSAQRTAAQNAAAAQAAQVASSAQSAEVRAATERAEVELRQRSGEARNAELQRQAQAAAVRAAEAQRQAEAAAGAARVEAQRQAEVARAEAQRLAEQAAVAASSRSSAAAQAASAAERAQLEERIAQGTAQQASARSAAQRLHEQARLEAAAHARASLDAARPASVAQATTAAFQPSAEIAAAIASLPPELAAILGSAAGQRPERAVQAIGELNETLRAAELLARSTASGAGFEVTRGPRMMMPAGLGGLVNAVDRAQSIASRPMLGGPRPLAPLAQFVAPEATTSSAAASGGAPAMSFTQASVRAGRVPALPWLAAAAPASSTMAPTSALGATAAAAPAALTHVAWADRWLARFAGANPQSLQLMTAAAGAAPEVRMQALAAIAPGAVFVAPDFLRGELTPASAAHSARVVAAQQMQIDAQTRRAALVQAGVEVPASELARSEAARSPEPTLGQLAEAARPDLRLINPPAEAARRFDDNEETPDDVFAAIAAAASRGRGAARPASSAQAQVAQAQAVAQAAQAQAQAVAQGAVERQTYADLVAHAAPSAPGAGLSAQLASSPFAPALRHVLPLPSATSFDVRSLFGGGLGATYLAGLVDAGTNHVETGAQLPTWASWDLAPLAQIGQARAAEDDRIDRIVPGFDAAYVTATDAALSSPAARAALEAQLEAGASPESANLAALRAAQADAAARAAAPTATSSSADAASDSFAAPAATVPAATLTTLRSALLSWGLTVSDDAVVSQATGAAAPALQQFAPTTFIAPPARGGVASMGAARTMLDVMAMPLLGDVDAAPAPAWSAPGMIADRAHSFSIAQERSASDLALDFVSPELVLAARVYGLGPAEAAQAARLAVVGPGQLGAMASAVDRTFVDAMAIVRDNRNSEDRRQRTALSTALTGEAADRGFVAPSLPAAGVTVPGAQPSAVSPVSGQAAEQLIATLTAQGASPAEVRAAIATAFPTADGAIAAALEPTTRAPASLSEAFGSQSHPSFGVDRRPPRGAFLWPQATVAALGMNAAGADGQLSMSVAALELLAAQVVAEVGTYAALSEANTGARISAGEASSAEVATAATAAVATSTSTVSSSPAAQTPMAAAIQAAIAAGVDPTTAAARAAQLISGAPLLATGRSLFAHPGGSEPAEADVLGQAAQLVPAARRARFDALYVALSQSPAGRSWSPAARAARALALAGRSDDTTVTARERAATAWDVLPVVYPSEAAAAVAPGAQVGSDGDLESAASAAAAAMSSYVAPSGHAGIDSSAGTWSAQGAVQRAARRHGAARGGAAGPFVAPDGFDAPFVAPSGLSARAGNALGAYVAPVSAPSAPSGSSSHVNSVGAVMRAPSANPEYVQTGRSSGRFGGGEVEIPSWFEAAARKMFADKSDSADGISMADLTLISTAPQSQIAASSRAAAATSAPPSPGGGAQPSQQAGPQIDVEKLAHDIYREILVMMDSARARNGDPYQ